VSISETVEQLLQKNNFKPARKPTKKKSSWLLPKSGQAFYVNRVSNEGVSLFIFNPENTAVAEEAVKKAGLQFNGKFYHSSNMTLFPRRTHTGASPIPYGCAVDVMNLTSANNLIEELKNK
jgi:hypothetical protein